MAANPFVRQDRPEPTREEYIARLAELRKIPRAEREALSHANTQAERDHGKQCAMALIDGRATHEQLVEKMLVGWLHSWFEGLIETLIQAGREKQ